MHSWVPFPRDAKQVSQSLGSRIWTFNVIQVDLQFFGMVIWDASILDNLSL